MNKQRIKKYLPVLFLTICIMIFSVLSVRLVNASVSLKKNDSNWAGTYNKLAGAATDIYPYNTSGSKVSSVSLDILYGVSKGLVTYHGELPYDLIYDGDDNYADGWEGYYAEAGTTITGANPTYGASAGSDATDYWGLGLSEKDFDNVKSAEQVNAKGIKSLRLYAASITESDMSQMLGSIPYKLVKGIAGIAIAIIKLFISAKNISVPLILESLKLDSLNNALVQNFIYDKGNAKLSPFTAFALLAFMFALASFALRWVRGSEKTKSGWEMLGTTLIGLLIIGMCLTGRISSLGTNIADLANNLIYVTTESLASQGNGKAFEVNISDSAHTNEIMQMSEMSMINRVYIDLQICAQFNVSDINELSFDNLGDPEGKEAKQYLAGVSSADMTSDFNNNLGYYFWYANSSAKDKTSLNASFPETNTLVANYKLSSMITYLQHRYNNGNADQKVLITKIMQGFADPGAGMQLLSIILYSVILILLAVALFKYALNVIIGKLELFIGLLGTIVAGPLILTSSKKLVKAGKSVLGIIVIAFIEVTIYSIIFDMIVYIISMVMAPNIPSMIIALALIFILIRVNPTLQEHIRNILNRVERTVSPTGVDAKRNMRSWAKRKASEAVNRYDNSTKSVVVGYDENGDEIIHEQARKGDKLSKLLNTGNNALFNEGNDHEGAIHMGRRLSKDRQDNLNTTADEKRKCAVKDINKAFDKINTESNALTGDIMSDRADIISDAKSVITDDDGNIIEEDYILDNLTDDERTLEKSYRQHSDELHAWVNNHEYQMLLKKQNDLDIQNESIFNEDDKLKLDEDEEKRLISYQKKISAAKWYADADKFKLDKAIEERASIDALKAHGISTNDIDTKQLQNKNKDLSKYINKLTYDYTVNEHKQELSSVLSTAIDQMTESVNNPRYTQSAKIGGANAVSIDKDAALDQAAAYMQLEQLRNNEHVVSHSEASSEVIDVVNNTARHYEIFANSERKAQYTQAKQDNGRVVSKATISEQLQSGVRNQMRAETSSENSAETSTIHDASDDIIKDVPRSAMASNLTSKSPAASTKSHIGEASRVNTTTAKLDTPIPEPRVNDNLGDSNNLSDVGNMDTNNLNNEVGAYNNADMTDLSEAIISNALDDE